MPPERLEDQLAYLIAGVNRQFEEELREKLRPQGVPIEQSRVLGLLADGQGRPMTELAEQVFVEPPTLTKIIDRMVAQSLVIRAPDPNDRRRVLIYATRRGQALWEKIGGYATEQQKRVLDRLSPADLARLTEILRGLIAE